MIFAVIPTVRRSVFEVIENLLQQRLPPSKIVVVDNSLSIEEEIAKHFPKDKVEVITPPENKGSAGGYALGMSRCLEYSDCQYIFTSDDDIIYETDAVFELYKNICELPDAGAVRCAWIGYEGDTMRVKTSVWTGVLIKRSVVQTIGLPKGELFLYGDDVEYFLRMNKNNFKLYIVKQARYLRRVRDYRTKKGFYSNPSRLYYAFRNEIYIGMVYDKFMLFRTIGYFLKNLVFMDFKSIKASVEGMKDGFMRKLGKNQKYLNFY